MRVAEAVCPFCGESLPSSFRSRAAPAVPTKRLGRAAQFAFGAAVAGTMAMTGCSDSNEPTPRDSGASVNDGGGPVALYGAPALDAGPAAPDSGGEMALYGAPAPPEDAG